MLLALLALVVVPLLPAPPVAFVLVLMEAEGGKGTPLPCCCLDWSFLGEMLVAPLVPLWKWSPAAADAFAGALLPPSLTPPLAGEGCCCCVAGGARRLTCAADVGGGATVTVTGTDGPTRSSARAISVEVGKAAAKYSKTSLRLHRWRGAAEGPSHRDGSGEKAATAARAAFAAAAKPLFGCFVALICCCPREFVVVSSAVSGCWF